IGEARNSAASAISSARPSLRIGLLAITASRYLGLSVTARAAREGMTPGPMAFTRTVSAAQPLARLRPNPVTANFAAQSAGAPGIAMRVAHQLSITTSEA